METPFRSTLVDPAEGERMFGEWLSTLDRVLQSLERAQADLAAAWNPELVATRTNRVTATQRRVARSRDRVLHIFGALERNTRERLLRLHRTQVMQLGLWAALNETMSHRNNPRGPFPGERELERLMAEERERPDASLQDQFLNEYEGTLGSSTTFEENDVHTPVPELDEDVLNADPPPLTRFPPRLAGLPAPIQPRRMGQLQNQNLPQNARQLQARNPFLPVPQLQAQNRPQHAPQRQTQNPPQRALQPQTLAGPQNMVQLQNQNLPRGVHQLQALDPLQPTPQVQPRNRPRGAFQPQLRNPPQPLPQPRPLVTPMLFPQGPSHLQPLDPFLLIQQPPNPIGAPRAPQHPAQNNSHAALPPMPRNRRRPRRRRPVAPPQPAPQPETTTNDRRNQAQLGAMINAGSTARGNQHLDIQRGRHFPSQNSAQRTPQLESQDDPQRGGPPQPQPHFMPQFPLQPPTEPQAQTDIFRSLDWNDFADYEDAFLTYVMLNFP